eukprot:s3137_g3.t1
MDRLLAGTTAISECARRSQWQAALETCFELQRKSVQADVVVFNASISGCETPSSTCSYVMSARTPASTLHSPEL